MRRTPLALLLALVLLLAACAGESDDQVTVDTVGGSPPTTEGRSPGTTERDRSPGTTERGGGGSGQVTDADLEPMLLEADDLPGTWVLQPADPDDSGGSSRPPCFEAVDQATSDGNPTAEVDFESPDGQRAIFEEISFLGTTAADEFETATGLLAECRDFAFTTDQGRQVTGVMRPIEFPNVADQTAAYRMDLTSGGITLVLDVAVLLSDEVVVIIGYGATSAPEAGSALAEYAKAAIDKVETVGLGGLTAA